MKLYVELFKNKKFVMHKECREQEKKELIERVIYEDCKEKMS